MELPPKLTNDLRVLQYQMKLAIQTHQNLRINHTNHPNLNEELREVEKHITCLGEKQNQLMRWLRKLLTSNSALMAKTVASTLGFAMNGTRQLCTSSQSIISRKHVLSPKTCNTAVSTSIKEKTQSTSSKLTVQRKTEKLNVETKERRLASVKKIVRESSKTGHVRMRVGRPSKRSLVVPTVDTKQQQIPESNERLSEPLTAEKERFLSAVGLVTREILKELQNKRVERKRRSTANHTQFVYGSSWEISSKKRKKSNYLASVSKQPVTRQAIKTQDPKIDVPQTLKVDQSLVIFKPPLPVIAQSQPLIVDSGNSCSSPPQAVMKSQLLLKSPAVLKHQSVAKSQSVLKTQTVTQTKPLLKGQPVIKSQPIVKIQPIVKSLPVVKSQPIVRSQLLAKCPPVIKNQSVSKSPTLIRSSTFSRNQTLIKSHSIMRSQTFVSNKDGCVDRLSSPVPSHKKGSECRIVETCIVCHKLAAGTIACSCNMRYHPSCADRIENCLGCGYKITCNFRDPSRAKEKSIINGRYAKKENTAHT